MKKDKADKKASDTKCVHIHAHRTSLSARSIPSAHGPLSTRAPSAYSHPRACGRAAAEIQRKANLAKLAVKSKQKAKRAKELLANAERTHAEAQKFLAGRSIS